MKVSLAKKTAALALGMACLTATAYPAMAEEEKPTADLTVAALSKYVWRGFELSDDSMVVQPSMTIGYKGFGFNLWGNLDTDTVSDNTNNWNETDMTLSYNHSFGKVGVGAGYIYYALDNAEDSQEFYASVSYDTLLSPTLTVYRDTDHYAGWYITAAISHSISFSDKLALDLGAKASYLKADDASSYAEVDTGEKYSAFHDGVLSAAMTIPVTTYLSVTPQLYYSFPLSSDAKDLIKQSSYNGNDSDFIYGGVSMSLSF